MKKLTKSIIEITHLIGKEDWDILDTVSVYTDYTRGKCLKLIDSPIIKDSWSFIPNRNMTYLIQILKTLKPNNLIDLGCGPGNIVYLADLILPKKSIGLDFYEGYIKIGKETNPELNLIYKDFFTLTRKDIRGIDIIYMYEPITRHEIQLELLKFLYNIMRKDQIILYKVDSMTYEKINLLRALFNKYSSNSLTIADLQILTKK